MRKGMWKSSQAITGLCVVTLLMCGVLRAQPPEAASLTLPNMPLHDPWILANETDKTYYLYTSNVPAV
ncbi:hypothetical protein FTW19_23790 [Terriglobus albidus]|uniref:Uncharacterized protein n=1 Tax=Terriglobus albidus TaxID=1592106 RepID=A0A5B9EK88_9BACT|nr:hypothetical protein [Terriglobus albidus]QEE30751.1 hypothetical protein FTW19_23790 [Terriglobus albidus]